MTNNQIAKNNMYKKLLAFFAIPANAAVWAAFARLVTEIANFVSLNGELDQATQTQAQDTKGIAQGKTDAYNAMVKMAVEMAFKAYVWAVDNNNDELTEVFNVQISDFDKIAQQTGFDKVKNIRDGIDGHIAGMAGVNLLPADVIALDWTVRLSRARKQLLDINKPLALQGNLDPLILFAEPKQIAAAASVLLDDLAGAPALKSGLHSLDGHIFNLGHGINQFTPPESVAALSETVISKSKALRATQ